MRVVRNILLLLAAASTSFGAGNIVLDFESLSDGTMLASQYPGVTFSNALILTKGTSLNEFEFPPHSGSNVAADSGSPMTLTFASPIQGFSGYFTHGVRLTLTAFNASNQQVAVVTSASVNNEALSGDAGSSPNELLQLTASSGISRITIAGDPAGYSFAMDDVALTPFSQVSPTLTTSASVGLYDTYSAFTLSVQNLALQTRALMLNASNGSLPYASSVSGSPTFLSVSPASGTMPASVTLTANPTGLAAGTYTNTVTFTGGGATTAYTVALTIQPASANSSKVGIYRAGLILLDRNGDGSCCGGDLVGTIGQAGDIPLSGDWSGTGGKQFGLYRPSTGLFLLDVNGDGTFNAGDRALTLASQPGDLPVVGDWTGTGVDRAGVFRGSNGTWYLDTNGDGSFVGRAYLGQSGDIPLVGNWNGAGTKSKVGIYRPTSVGGQPGNFFLVDTNGDGQYTGADQPLFFLGQSGDLPILGDWSGDGKTKVGIFRPGNGLFILDQNGSFSWDGPGTDKVQYFQPYLNGLTSTTTAQAGDIPVTGNWVPSYGAQNTVNLQGRTRTGLFRPSTGTFFMDVSGDGTFQGRAFLGQSGDVPIGIPTISSGVIIGVNLLGNF